MTSRVNFARPFVRGSPPVRAFQSFRCEKKPFARWRHVWKFSPVNSGSCVFERAMLSEVVVGVVGALYFAFLLSLRSEMDLKRHKLVMRNSWTGLEPSWSRIQLCYTYSEESPKRDLLLADWLMPASRAPRLSP